MSSVLLSCLLLLLIVAGSMLVHVEHFSPIQPGMMVQPRGYGSNPLQPRGYGSNPLQPAVIASPVMANMMAPTYRPMPIQVNTLAREQEIRSTTPTKCTKKSKTSKTSKCPPCPPCTKNSKCPEYPDMSQYIRLDEIPCWNCSLP